MKLSEAEIKIQRLANIPFKDYLNPDVFKDAMLKPDNYLNLPLACSYPIQL